MVSTTRHSLVGVSAVMCWRFWLPFQLFAPPVFQLSERIPVILNTVFVTLAFSSGMPLLLPFAFFALALSYWIDKYALLRVYAKPPSMGDDLHQVALTRSSTPVIRWRSCRHAMLLLRSDSRLFGRSGASCDSCLAACWCGR